MEKTVIQHPLYLGEKNMYKRKLTQRQIRLGPKRLAPTWPSLHKVIFPLHYVRSSSCLVEQVGGYDDNYPGGWGHVQACVFMVVCPWARALHWGRTDLSSDELYGSHMVIWSSESLASLWSMRHLLSEYPCLKNLRERYLFRWWWNDRSFSLSQILSKMCLSSARGVLIVIKKVKVFRLLHDT